jgi:hypothetical protein
MLWVENTAQRLATSSPKKEYQQRQEGRLILTEVGTNRFVLMPTRAKSIEEEKCNKIMNRNEGKSRRKRKRGDNLSFIE